MHRRRYLALLGAVGVAGCSGGDGGDGGGGDTPPPTDPPTATATQSPSPTATPTETPTATPTPTASLVSLIYRWDQFGDVREHTIDSAGQGVSILLGGRFTLVAQGGEISGIVQFEVTGPGGDQRASEQLEISELVSGNGPIEYEQTLWVDTEGWPRGVYDVELVARDEQTDSVSEGVSGTFELLKPLGGDEVSLVNVDAPSEVAVGEPYQFTLQFQNHTDRANSVQTSLSLREDGGDWYTYTDNQIECTIPPDVPNTWESSAEPFSEASEYTYRLDRLDETWSVTVTA